MERVAIMPLPDASKKSPRVYKNLKTTDLEDVTFSNMESTGDPISIEMLNEDEMRRLVLVQLARLSVKSEWNGLLTSSSGGGSNGGTVVPNYDLMQTSGTRVRPGELGAIGRSFQTLNTWSTSQPLGFPFIAPHTGEINEVFVRVQAAAASQALLVGIYDTDADEKPTELLGQGEIDVTSTGERATASFSASVTKGSVYYIFFVLKAGGNNPSMYVYQDGGMGYNQSGITGAPGNAVRMEGGTSYTLPDPARGDGNYEVRYQKAMLCEFTYS